jgi:hypothetical protein
MKFLAAVVLVAAAFWIGLNGLRLPKRPLRPFKLPVRQAPIELVPSPLPKTLPPR